MFGVIIAEAIFFIIGHCIVISDNNGGRYVKNKFGKFIITISYVNIL